jgi:hypothetical protein
MSISSPRTEHGYKDREVPRSPELAEIVPQGTSEKSNGTVPKSCSGLATLTFKTPDSSPDCSLVHSVRYVDFLRALVGLRGCVMYFYVVVVCTSEDS